MMSLMIQAFDTVGVHVLQVFHFSSPWNYTYASQTTEKMSRDKMY